MIEIARARELVGSQPLTLSHPDPQVSRRLPYHFAKARGVIAVRQVGAAIELWVREDSEFPAGSNGWPRRSKRADFGCAACYLWVVKFRPSRLLHVETKHKLLVTEIQLSVTDYRMRPNSPVSFSLIALGIQLETAGLLPCRRGGFRKGHGS